MNRLVWYDGTHFAIRDAKGFLHYPTKDELSKYVSKTEIAAARHQYESNQMPLPSFDIESGQYYWSDPSDLWDAEDVASDIELLWPGMPVAELLESSRLMAKLGITD